MAILGDLEHRVMDVLWQAHEALSVRDVHSVVTKERDLAYTTVMTVLDRLAKKGVVGRARDGRQWLYVTVQSREGMVANQMLELLPEDDGGRRDALVALVRRLDSPDRDVLAETLAEDGGPWAQALAEGGR